MQLGRSGGLLRTVSKIRTNIRSFASNFHGCLSWLIFLSREGFTNMGWNSRFLSSMAHSVLLHNISNLARRIIISEPAKYLYVSSFLITLIMFFPYVASGVIERAWQLFPYSPYSWFAFLALFIAAVESVMSWLPDD
jgi:hypothetical protein